MTGFRFCYGGAQSYYGVTPDLCTLGKISGGGFPLAAIAGRADIMAHFDRGIVGDDGFLMQVGTLSGNPVASAAGLAWDAPAPFESGRRLGEALLDPTRLYVRPVLAVLRSPAGAALKALAHVTGGGLVENPPRVLPAGLGAVIDLDAVVPPPVFGWLSGAGGIEEREMLRTFNCGIGMVAVVDEAEAGAVEAALADAGETVFRISRVQAGARGCEVRGSVETWSAREAWRAAHDA